MNEALKRRAATLWGLIKDTYDRYSDDHGDILAASISFYTLLSLAPLIVVALTIAGVVFGRDEARASLLDNVRRYTSEDIAQLLMRQLDAAEAGSGRIAAVLALLVLVWAASRLFIALQEALNVIWAVPTREAGSTRETILRFVVKRLISLAMVMGTGALLLSVLVLQTVLSDVSGLAQRLVPEEWVTGVYGLTQQTLLPLALLSVTCAVIYRVLPDVRIHWRDVWVGSALTAALVLLGTWLLGLYLSRIAPGWLQGAVGSIAVFMVWTYYLAQVFLFGAAFTRVWSGRAGGSWRPSAPAG
jgi:membrane protein